MLATTILSGLLASVSIVSALPAPVDPLKATLNLNLKRSETGPVIPSNFPDPTVIEVGGKWFAFATRTKGSAIHVQAATSPNFNTWSLATNSDGSQYDALPTLGSWVDTSTTLSSNVWAPSIVELSANSFVMYYSATAKSSNKGAHCIGAATATSVLGPYTPKPNALFCPLAQGGAIDPAGFQDINGQRYIVYKIDGNSIGAATPLILQPVAADGITLQGTATTLLNNNGASDENVIEAPSIARTQYGTYVLTFSSGTFTDSSYTVSYAVSNSVTGPYTRNPNPLFKTGVDGLTAPGSATLASDASHMVFHANYGTIPNYGVGRAMYTADVTVTYGVLSA